MNEDGSTRHWRLVLFTVAAVVFASLALNVGLIWNRFGTDNHVVGAHREAEPATAQLVETHAMPLRAEDTGERPQSAGNPSRPQGENKTPRIEADVRGGVHEPTSSASAAGPASAQSREPGAPNSTGRVASTSGPAANAPAAPGVASSGASVVVPHAPDLRGGVAGEPTSGSEESKPDLRGEEPTPEPTPPGDATPGDSDHTPPVLGALQFNPPLVEGGSVTTLSIQATDDLSGVKSFSGEVRSPKGLATIPFWSQVAGAVPPYTFQLKIPKGAESGVWYVSWISITDGADNNLLLQASAAERAPAGGTFTVTSQESDSTAPDVRQVWFDKSTVDGGDKNTIRVEVHDEESGVASIMGACQSPSKAALIWFTCTLDSGSGAWAGDVAIPKNAECGSWGIQQLAAKDKAGNTALLNADSPILVHAGFQVSSRADCDSTPPSLDSFELSPTVVSSETASEIVVTATVYDAGSGTSQMTGWFDGPISEGGQAPKNYIHCPPPPSDPRAPWSCKIQVPRLAAKGVWKVGVLRLEDKAHNFREYTAADPVVSNRVFEVQ